MYCELQLLLRVNETGMDEISPRRNRALLEVLPAALLLPLTLVAFLATTGLTASAGGHVAVFGPPWAGFQDAARIVSLADGRILDAGATSNVVIAQASSPEFVSRLYAAGAWLVLDWENLAGCRSTQRRSL